MKAAIFGGNSAAIAAGTVLCKNGFEAQIISSVPLNVQGVEVISYDMMRGKYDIIVLADDYDIKSICQQISQFLRPEAKVVSLMPTFPEIELNGFFGEDKVAMGVYEDKILLKEGEAAKSVKELLLADYSADILSRRFAAMAEASFGGICSVAGCNMQMVASNEAWMNILVKTVREFSDVCNAEQVYDLAVGGYPIADLITMKGFFKKKYPVKKLISAVPDYSKKNPAGEFASITAYAKKDGIDVPFCEKTASILNDISAGKLTAGPQNIKMY